MKKFEYKETYYGSHDLPSHKIASYLNDEGAAGWELIQFIEGYFISPSQQHNVANYRFYFKRERVSKAKTKRL